MTNPISARIVLAYHPALKVFDDHHLEQLDALGTLLNTSPVTDWNTDESRRLLSECNVICGHWGCPAIDGAVIGSAPELGLIAYGAGTLRDVMSDDAWRDDIRVTSGAIANAEPVAQFTVAAIVMASKRVLWRSADPTDRRAALAGMNVNAPVGLYRTTVGIIGASLIGRRVIELLHAFGDVDIVVYDPYLDDTAAAQLGVRTAELDDLCAESDIVSIHAPALPATHHMIGHPQLIAMRDGATLINTARGSLVDHDALTDQLRAGRITAVLDVTEPEPLPADHELRSLPGVLITPHIAGSQGVELGRLADYVIDEIGRWCRGEPAANEVRRSDLGRLA